MSTVTLIAAVLSFFLAITIARANPHRFSNRAFSLILIIVALWLGCVFGAMLEGMAFSRHEPNQLLFWVRANAAVLGFLPAALWLLTSGINNGAREWRPPWRQVLALSVLTLVLVALTLTESFAFEESFQIRRGTAYYMYNIVGICIHFTCIARAWQHLRRSRGIRRIELQILVYSSSIIATLICSLNVVGNYLQERAYNRASIVVVFAGVVFAAWTLLFHRVFNARELVLSVGRLFIVLFGTAAVLWLVWSGSREITSVNASLLVVLLLAAPVGISLTEASRRLFGGTTEQRMLVLRRLVIDLSRTEPIHDRLVAAFADLLIKEFRAGSAALLPAGPTLQVGNNCASNVAHRLLLELGWITPESLERRPANSVCEELKSFLRDNAIGAMLTVPLGSPTPSLIAVLQEKTTGWPYTYPEIERLQNITELMDNILTRSRLTEQAALQARVEHLAMMSRGLAHDLKNLITPVSSFLIHTEGKYAPDSPEAEVHAAARRSVRIMTDYVREALFFSERLAPKFELVALSRTLSAVVEITAPRACRRGVNVATDCDPGLALVADNVLLQRMLANFATNAIDASPSGATVTLSAAAHAPDRILVQITDRGCGIAPEHLPRIFDAYFTTKEFGDEIRGFGLGLTIARKIADLHSATISVKSRLGEGTTIAVDLPARQTIALAAPAPHCVIADAAAS